MKLTKDQLKRIIKEELQKEAHWHDMGGEDEMYNVLDKPNQLSPKEIYGEFENFVRTNNLDREDIMGMVNIMFDELRETQPDEAQ